MSVPERWQEVGENSNDNEVWILSPCSPLIDSKSRVSFPNFLFFPSWRVVVANKEYVVCVLQRHRGDTLTVGEEETAEEVKRGTVSQSVRAYSV